MRLQRVQIPNFRVLKDIDITFEPHRIPQIFPLASQNGGGKSTLLQLIFTLLTCLGDSSKSELIENILENSIMESFVDNSKLATLLLTDNGVDIRLDFYFRNNNFLFDGLLVDFDSDIAKDFLEHGMDGYRSRIAVLEALIQEKPPLGIPEKNIRNQNANFGYFEWLQESINILKEIENGLESRGGKAIYSRNNLNLTCEISEPNKDWASVDLFKRISESVFMAAPSSQAFLFLSSSELSTLFGEASDYQRILKDKQKNMINLFLHEFSMVQVLIDAFKKAFNNDRAQAIRSGGKYGNEFELLLKDLRDFLNGKTIQPSDDMSKIVIKQQNKNNQEIELNPSDLSHGELRRLSFYAWLKTNRIRNSIVLVDEIEIGMHPDWQYQIVRDLEEWEPSNQYILATHSYEVCSALSPSHVKEIEPKLLKSEAQTAQ
jgi:predicted ATP-dependent endonuclease of OLD family